MTERVRRPGERRVRVLWVPEDQLLTMLLMQSEQLPTAVVIPVMGDVPPGCEVEQVQHSWERRAFGFFLRHPSFAPVPEGDFAPSFADASRRHEAFVVEADASTPDACGRLKLVEALRRENDRLRGVFGDLMQDSPAARACYEQGKADAGREQEPVVYGQAEFPPPMGLYVLHWVGGGSSLASVGQLYDGTRWYAPCNWTSATPEGRVTSTDWNMVERAECLRRYS